MPQMEAMLQQGQYQIYDFYQRLAVHYLDWHDLPPGWERSLLNINTREQLERMREEES